MEGRIITFQLSRVARAADGYRMERGAAASSEDAASVVSSRIECTQHRRLPPRKTNSVLLDLGD